MNSLLIRKRSSLLNRNDSAVIIDVTSKSDHPWVRFSPFYPHTSIPVPFCNGVISRTVEGIWQGLKVFERSDVDATKFEITTMKGIKRSARKYGHILGHRAGIAGSTLLSYVQARILIYLPSYKYILDNYLGDEIRAIRNLLKQSNITLLDYEINGDIANTTTPLSHAFLIKYYVENSWPTVTPQDYPGNS